MEYTDSMGLRVLDLRIQFLLENVGKTEDEIVNFLGKDMAEFPGAFLIFLEMFASQIKWHKNRGMSK